MPRQHDLDPALPASAAAFAVGASPKYAPDTELCPVHVDLNLQLDIPARRATVEATTRVRAIAGGRPTLVLDAIDLEIEAVHDPDGRALQWRTDGAHLFITWVAPFEAGELRPVTVCSVALRPITGLHFSSADPSRPAEPQWAATDHETERARYWLPCVDHPSVRPSWTISIRSLARHTSLAGGIARGEEAHGDGTRTVRWELEHPTPSYLLCLCVGDLVRAEGGRPTAPGHEGLEIAFFAPPPFTAADLSRTFGPTAGMMDWLVGRLGVPFPFPKYFQFAAHQIGGAMENISLVSWDDAWVQDERGRAEFGHLVDLVNLHEMSHSWFGDAVVVRDFAHVWLKESWATYMEAVWLEETDSLEAMHVQLYNEKVEYLGEAEGRYMRPIITRRYDSSWDMFDRHLYPGGAVRLHMLRKIVGDVPFWKGVQRYLSHYGGEVVETDHFRREIEATSGLYLARFFEQWFESPGHPTLKVELHHDARRGELRITVDQTQIDAARGVGAFDLPLDVAVEEAEGRWSHHRLPLSGPRHSLLIPLASAPLQVQIDPESAVLAVVDFDPGADMLRRSLGATSVSARLHAAHTLAKGGRASDVAAVVEAWRAEPRWGIRVIYATALGKGGSEAALQGLATLIAEEVDPRAMMGTLDAVGGQRHPEVHAALRAWLALPERPYRAAAAALRNLGLQRDPADMALLVAWAEAPEWWGQAAKGALTGLGSLRTEAAVHYLRGRAVAVTDRTQVRVGAVEALADAARWSARPAQEQAVELLVGLLRDPVYNIRIAAARALSALGLPEAAAAIEAALPSLATQDHPRVRRLASGLRRGGPGAELPTLQRSVEALQDKLRKALDRIEALEARQA